MQQALVTYIFTNHAPVLLQHVIAKTNLQVWHETYGIQLKDSEWHKVWELYTYNNKPLK